MKRSWFLYLMVVLTLICLGITGCGGKKETGGPGAPNKPAGSQEAGQPAKEVSATDLLTKGKEITGMSFEYILTMPTGKMTGKVWMEGRKMKTESTVEGRKMIALIDGEANTFYTYYPDQNMAMKLSSQELGKETQPATPTDYIQNTDPNALKTLETTIYDGVKCKVLMVQNTQDKTQVKMWVREDYGIPIRVEVTAPDGVKTVMEYKDLKIGPQPPDTFKLPADVKITNLNEMMKQLPGVPGSQQ